MTVLAEADLLAVVAADAEPLADVLDDDPVEGPAVPLDFHFDLELAESEDGMYSSMYVLSLCVF